jgi:hypothetical protein
MAPRVGLQPTLFGNDLPKFDIHRARIPTPLFKDIIKDLDIIMKQYGEPRDHGNEVARSRFLAPVSIFSWGSLATAHDVLSFLTEPSPFSIWPFVTFQNLSFPAT